MVEKRTVVRHQHHRPRIVGQIVLQPYNTFDIKVIRRLVEQQEIGSAEQQLGQLNPHLPSSAEHSQRTREVAMPETETKQHLLGRLLTSAAPHQGQMLRHLVVTFQQSGV